MKGWCSMENLPSIQCLHCLRTTPCIIYIQFHPLSKKAFLPPPPPPPTRGAQTNQYPPTYGYFSLSPEVVEVMGLMTVSYLQVIYFMVDHKQEHHSTDGLHNNGAIVHRLPVRGDVNMGLLTNSISPLHLKGLLSRPCYHSSISQDALQSTCIHIEHTQK